MKDIDDLIERLKRASDINSRYQEGRELFLEAAEVLLLFNEDKRGVSEKLDCS